MNKGFGIEGVKRSKMGLGLGLGLLPLRGS